MTEHNTQEFDLMYKGRIQYVTARFDFSAWVDCYDPQDSRSEFIDWEYELTELEYFDDFGKRHTIQPPEVKMMKPEMQEYIDKMIHNELENYLTR